MQSGCGSLRVIRTTLSSVQRILHTDVVPLHPPNPPPAPFPGTSWSPEAKLATQKAPASAPVEAQLTGAQLVQKREIIRESSRRSKASTGWRRKSTLQNNGCWFKNLSVCFRRTMPDPVEHMIAPSVSAASDNLTPSTPSTQRCCLTLGVQSAAVVLLPFHSFSSSKEEVWHSFQYQK